MIQNELDKLKSLIENDGYEVLNESPDDNDKFFVVRVKKDLWEGVEFCKFVDDIHKISHFEHGKYGQMVWSTIGKWVYKKDATPSTETAYVDQLKKEAFERFGDVRDGDRFVSAVGVKDCKCGYDMEKWYYTKEKDSLYSFGVLIYQSGKWAKKIEKFTVEIFDESLDCVPGGVHFGVTFKINKPVNPTVSATILAQALEKHLNNE